MACQDKYLPLLKILIQELLAAVSVISNYPNISK
jgi:hypothetical protein